MPGTRHELGVRPRHGGAGPVALDEHHAAGAPAGGLEAERAGAGEQVEHPGTVEPAEQVVQRGEHGLPDAVGRRAGPAGGDREPPPPRSARR